MKCFGFVARLVGAAFGLAPALFAVLFLLLGAGRDGLKSFSLSTSSKIVSRRRLLVGIGAGSKASSELQLVSMQQRRV